MPIAALAPELARLLLSVRTGDGDGGFRAGSEAEAELAEPEPGTPEFTFSRDADVLGIAGAKSLFVAASPLAETLFG